MGKTLAWMAPSPMYSSSAGRAGCARCRRRCDAPRGVEQLGCDRLAVDGHREAGDCRTRRDGKMYVPSAAQLLGLWKTWSMRVVATWSAIATSTR
jgi:hypothetical protein